MNLKSLFLLIAAVFIGFAVYYYSANQKQVSDQTNAPLISGLKTNLNNINRFTITEAGDTILTQVSKSEDGWVVDNREGYPANIATVRQAFSTLADATLIEAKTANPENYAKLGVEDIKDKNAQGVLLNVEGLNEPVAIIFGNQGSSGKNTQFVRRKDEQQSWLIDKKVTLDKDVTEWLQKDLLDIPPERLKSIHIKHADTSEINISNTGNAAYEFTLDAITAPEGKKISDSEIYQVANALSSLQLRDVSSFASLSKNESEPTVTTFKTFDGLTITTKAYASDIEPYFTIDVEFNQDDVDETVISNDDSDSTSDAALKSDPKSAQELANTAKTKLDGWAYLLPTITKNALTKKLDDFYIEE